MKNKIITTLLLASAFVYSFAQDNKPGPGAIGLHYGVNFNGSVQQFVGISGVLNNHWELGGTLSFSYNHSNTSTITTGNVEGITGPLPGTFTMGNKSSNYTVGISPYLLYHFTINNNLDLYVGPAIGVGFSNGNNHKYTTATAANYLESEDELTSGPPTITMGLGGVLGCQYFFYKNLAIGVQAGLLMNYSYAKGNNIDMTTITGSGANNPEPGTTITSGNSSSQSNHSFNLSTAASGGISLAFYFSRTAKKQ